MACVVLLSMSGVETESVVEDKLHELEGWIEKRFDFPPGADQIKELRRKYLRTFLDESGGPSEEILKTEKLLLKRIEEEEKGANGVGSSVSDIPPPGAES